MAFIKVVVDPIWINVSFGDYTDKNSPVFNSKIYKVIDGLEPDYLRRNLVLIYKDKDNDKVTWIKMKDSMTTDYWPLTHVQDYNPATEGKMAFIVSDINGTTTWNSRDEFIASLKSLAV